MPLTSPAGPKLFLCGFVMAAALLVPAAPLTSADDKPAETSPAIDFARQIRPILSDNCFACHGPDESQRKAKLRLDTKEGALKALRGGGHAIVPGKPDQSEAIRRVLSKDAAERMPPARINKKLTPEQIDLLRRWVAQGAAWGEHWAFVTAQRPALPKVAQTAWPRNAIDHFVLARLERDRLKPTAEADRARLIRRVTFDLTGLPPTPAEVDAFLKDNSPDAYEKVVDRLLSSPHYGERMALDWLDAARFADTHGYHIDSGRDMTRWREYVIDAFNHNKPFDRFTVEQLAGDLLPNATLEQKIASGFNRNHMINFEGGAIPEEYQTAYVVDRVSTTGTVWLGLSLACAQCHDHKYDPISQKDFYRLYAFFNNVPERGLDGAKGNAAPVLKAPTRQQLERYKELKDEIRAEELRLEIPHKEADALQALWEKTAVKSSSVRWEVLEPHKLTARGGATLKLQDDNSVLASGPNPATDTYTVEARTGLGKLTAIKLEALPHASLTDNGPGRSVNGNIVLTDFRVQARTEKAGAAVTIPLGRASATFSQKDFPISNAIDKNPTTGWAIHPEVGKALSATFEPSAMKPAADGGPLVLTVTLDFNSKFGQHTLGRFRLSVTDSPNPAGKDGLPPAIAFIINSPREQRTPKQVVELRVYYRANVWEATRALQANLTRLRQELAALEKSFSTTMVMEEMPKPRPTHVLIRGEYDKKGTQVTAGVPAALHALPKDAPNNRLGLARWLVDPANPLTPRVTVNRYWQMFFGTGLVKSAEDFGSQGDAPSHPELLDWLASEFVKPSGAPLGSATKQPWDVRALVRLIVTSATYRQSSATATEAYKRDPENRLLARGPRYRLQAEFIRDQALAVSGLLNRDIGGHSVSPYQPPGLWQELASRGDSKNWSAQFFELSKGRDLYRRTMYTFWKRTSPPPQLMTFDAPDRETCVVRRSRTNTPLQALVLMNDPTYVEASRKFAERLMHHSKATDERIAFAFRHATARTPSARETEILRGIYEKQLARYRADAKAAERLLSVGQSPRDARLDAAELAAWSMVASTILNLDEAVTRN